MKRLVALVIVLTVSCAAFAVDKSEFDEVVDFSLSLEQIHARLQDNPQKLLSENKAVVLDGIVASISILSADQNNFQALLELVNGEWRGLEDVVMFRSYVVVYGPEFYRRIPTRENREPENPIESNSRVKKKKNVANIVEGDEEGSLIPVIDGYYIRSLP